MRTPFGGGILELVRFARCRRASRLPLLLASSLLLQNACVPGTVVVTPGAAPPPVCPAGGCNAPADAAVASDAAGALCVAAGDAPCAGSSPAECTERALSAWSEATDDRDVACVARMLGDACSLQDARACAFAGRLSLDGRGTRRDVQRGLDMLMRGCDGGVAMACEVGAHWLGESSHATDVPGGQELVARLEGQRTCLAGQSEACFQVGVLFYYGREAFPRDRGSSSRAFSRGCDLGDSRACNNLGDAMAYGDGVPRDVEAAASSFLKACRLGEALGCANLGYMAEHGEGVARDRPRARSLYSEACRSGDIYGCLHLDLLAAEDAGAPRDPDRSLAHWRLACEHGRVARACAYVGVIYEDGPDGVSRDEEKSMQAMARACDLGDSRACEWVKSHPDD
jgi:TPR repeat protein